MNRELLIALLAQGGVRLDDTQTALLDKQLQYIKSKTYDVQYSVLKAAEFIPFSSEVPEGAETWVYRQYDQVGMAKVISNPADDLPMVDILQAEFPQPIITIGDAYSWSVLDLKRAAFSGTPLEAKKAMAARQVIERRIDQIAAFGETARNTRGFLNHPNVPHNVVTNGNWLTATADQILADLYESEQLVIDTTNEVHEADTLILPSAYFGRISTLRLNTQTDATVLQHFLKNAQSIKSVGRWNKLATANGGAPRGMMYKRSPEVVEFVLPNPFESLPPEKRNLTYVVNNIARVGGVVFYYPLSAVYLDGIDV